ncbi:MAG: 50S ribosomal protein L11 methyltransferase [Blastocatellia bacterium]
MPDLAMLSDLLEQIKQKIEGLQNTVNKDVISMWYTFYNPYPLGSKFVVIRSWQMDELKEDLRYFKRIAIKIDPGVSFGRGHATTNLIVQAMEKYWQGGSILDVGTGTGILAIASFMLAKDKNMEVNVDAFDISENIVEEAKRNLKINGINSINLKLAEITDYPSKTYDVVIANLLPEIHEKIAKDLFNKVKKNGLLIVSGFPTESKGAGGAYFDWDATLTKGSDSKVMEKLFKKLGLILVEHISLENNSALILRK